MESAMYDSFDGPHRSRGVNLSTTTSSSSSALLTSVRAERLARERLRQQERAALFLQAAWRGRSERRKLKRELLVALENGEVPGGFAGSGRAMVVLTMDGFGDDQGGRRGRILERWSVEGREADPATGLCRFLAATAGSDDNITILAILCMRILQCVAQNPQTAQAGSLLSSLEVIFDPSSYARLGTQRAASAKEQLVDSVGSAGWVRSLVDALEKLVAASQPKKKHPHLQPITCLLTAPLSLCQPLSTSPLIPELLNELLAVPSLPSVLPLPSLTHLSTHLPLFTVLLPAAVSEPRLLSQGRLSTELGKTYFLANLATFGITGGMLQRYGARGAPTWITVTGTVLSQVGEGWGRWAEGMVEDTDEDVSMRQTSDEDEEDDLIPLVSTSTSVRPPRKPSRQIRPPLPANLRPKLLVLASPSHLSTLASLITSPTSKVPTTLLVDFASFVLGLLHAFRGSPKWEGILEALMEGQRGRALGRRLWREGVRGRWRNSGERAGWDTFSSNPAAPCLLFLTTLYNHYLLLTPDDEFFSDTSSKPISLDEVLELAGIWRDLAFWGYMNGLAPSGSASGKSPGTEEARALFTRGVTRVAERNARKQFAAEDFWVMSGQLDLRGFVEAAVFEDAELSQPDAETEEIEGASAPGRIPRWAQARQRYTKRQMAYISPRLGLLNNLPMAVPFQTRLEVFRQFVNADRQRLGMDEYIRRQRRSKEAVIHRTSLAEDGFRQLNDMGPGLKSRIWITFIDQFGREEKGIDGGGLFKEFLTNLVKDVFDTNRGLWLATDQNELYPNPHSFATESHQLSWYGFIGRVLGKAIYEGILVDISFAGFFLAKWLGRQSYLDDLNSLDSELYKGLIVLKNYPKPEELSLNFTITEQEFGATRSIDLMPGGSEVAVTAENRHEYIQLVCKYKLDKQIAAQSRAFFNGLSDIIDSKWLRMFDQQELQQLIGGVETLIDMDDLKEHTEVSGFPNDRTEKLFWRVVKSFDQEERKALLRFVTSCSRPPLLGFQHLYPKFGIRWAGTDVTRLPSASSCFNLLKLPGYNDEYSLRSKLLQAITSGAGFEMS